MKTLSKLGKIPKSVWRSYFKETETNAKYHELSQFVALTNDP